MFQIDDKFLESLGLGALPAADKDAMKNHIYETLEMNVGMRLASNMSDAQLNEFEQLMDQNDEAGALKWLETNFPDYKQVVSDELEKLKQEIKQAAPQIVSQAQQGHHPQFNQPVPGAVDPMAHAGSQAQPPQQPPANESFYGQPQPGQQYPQQPPHQQPGPQQQQPPHQQ